MLLALACNQHSYSCKRCGLWLNQLQLRLISAQNEAKAEAEPGNSLEVLSKEAFCSPETLFNISWINPEAV